MNIVYLWLIAVGSVAVITFLAAALPAHVAIKTQNIDYKIGNATYQGYLAFDDSGKSKRPGRGPHRHLWPAI